MTRTFRIVGSAKSSTSVELSYPALVESLKKNGLHVSNSISADLYISINHNEETYSKYIKAGGNARQTVLIRLEPEAVFPLQYKTSITEKYSLIITPGSVIDFKCRGLYVGWPYRFNFNPAKPLHTDPDLLSVTNSTDWESNFNLDNWQARTITVALVAANKVSPIRNSNYGIRRNLALNISSNVLRVYGPLWKGNLREKIRHRVAVSSANLRQGVFPNPFTIYGNLLAKYPTAHGTIVDKHELIRQSKFSLVIENSNTYVSEKLIDAILGGSVPIYIGPSLADVGLPRGIAIPSSGDYLEIMEIIKESDSKEIQKILLAMKDFLESSLFTDTWNEESAYEKIAVAIVALDTKISE